MTQGWWCNGKIHSSVQPHNEKLWGFKSTGSIITDNKIKLKGIYKHTHPFKENSRKEFMSWSIGFLFF